MAEQNTHDTITLDEAADKLQQLGDVVRELASNDTKVVIHLDVDLHMSHGIERPARNAIKQRFYTPAEAADRLALDTDTVRGLARCGAIKAGRIGRMFRISERALSLYLAHPEKHDEHDPIFNSTEAARWLKVDRGTLRNLQRRGVIKAETNGWEILVRRSELERYLRSRPSRAAEAHE